MTTEILEQPVKHRAATSGSKRNRKRLVVAGTAALIVAGGAGTAWAAYALFGFGQINTDAAVTQNLTVNNTSAQLTGTLVPGKTVGAKAVVTNPNDFAVTVTNVIVRNSTLAVNPNTAECQNTVHVIGSATTWPGEGGGPGTLQALAANVTIAGGESAWVTVPNAVKQDASATTLCGIKADFAVKAQTAD